MPRCSLSYAKIMQIESRIAKLRLSVMPRCSLSYAKITQIESRIAKHKFERYAEMQLILCKDNANREQNR